MTESISPDMDAILDDVLDELDDSDSDNGVESTAPAPAPASATSMNDEKRVPFGPVRPPVASAPAEVASNNPEPSAEEEQLLAESFCRMFQDLADGADPNGSGNGADPNAIGNRLMQQMQSELKQATSGNDNDFFDLDDKQLQETMSAILGGMGDLAASNPKSNPKSNPNATEAPAASTATAPPSPVTTDSNTTHAPSKPSTTEKQPESTTKGPVKTPTTTDTASASASDEEKLLQGLFRGLMAATDGAGDNDNPSEHEDVPNLDDLFAGLGGGDSGDADTDNFLDGIMEQLLSKELMYEPMKQVAEKFPSWLERNQKFLTPEEWDQRNRQHECFQRLVRAYEEETDDDDDDNTKRRQTQRLLELMQQVQEYGQPPVEIINEIAPGLELDDEGLPKMNLPGGAMPPFMGMGNGNPGEEECRIM